MKDKGDIKAEQYILKKLSAAGIDPFKTGLHFKLRRLKSLGFNTEEEVDRILGAYDLKVTIKILKDKIVDITEETIYDMARAPESSPSPFPGYEYVIMMPKWSLHISLKK